MFNNSGTLRERAEKKLLLGGPPDDQWGRAEPKKVLQELRLCKAELQLQEEDLGRSRTEAEETRHDYAMMFENAPAVYFVLDRYGLILEANRRARELTGAEHGRISGRPFRRLLRDSGHVDFISFCQRLFSPPFRETAEFVLQAPGRDLPIRLEGCADLGARRCYVAVLESFPEAKTDTAMSRFLQQLKPAPGPAFSTELQELSRMLEVMRLDLTALDKGSRQSGETFKRPRVDKLFQTLAHIAASVGRLAGRGKTAEGSAPNGD